MLEAQAQAPLYKFRYSDQQLLNSDKQRLNIVHQDSEFKIFITSNENKFLKCNIS